MIWDQVREVAREVDLWLGLAVNLWVALTGVIFIMKRAPPIPLGDSLRESAERALIYAVVFLAAAIFVPLSRAWFLAHFAR